MFYRGMGIDSLMSNMKDLLGWNKEVLAVVPFSDAARYFGDSPLKYLAGTILTTFVDILRNFNLLL
jgi:hypothetical protein